MWRVLRRYGYCLLVGASLAAGCTESTRSKVTSGVSGAGGSSGGFGGALGTAGVIALGGGDVGGSLPNGNFACPLQTGPAALAKRLSVVDIDGALTTIFGEGPTLAERVTWRETGYARVISPEFVAALRRVAVARAKVAVADDESFEVCDGAPAKDTTCVEDFLREWGERIYRRPLADEQLLGYVAQFRGAGAGVAAARNALVSMLVSPFFAMRFEFSSGKYSDYVGLPELAARISHFAARTTPDDALRASVASGALSEPSEVLAQYQRLVATSQGKAARATFVLEWLGIDKPVTDPSLGREQQAELIQRAGQQASDILEQSVTLDALLTSPRTPELPPELAVGMLASEAFLSRYPRPTSRGIEIQLALLGVKVPDSPPGVLQTLGPGDTPRERVLAVLDQAYCNDCHRTFDPIGFALDAFDELGQPTGFDSSGFVTVNGAALDVKNPAELGQKLAASEAARNTAARRLLELALDRRLDDDPGSGLVDFAQTDPPPSYGGQGGGGQGGTTFGVPPIPNIPIDPDTTWLRCIQHTSPVNQPLDLTKLAELIVASDGFRRTAFPPRAVVAFDVSADPVEHAIQEATTLIGAIQNGSDVESMNQYRLALLEVVRRDQLPGEGDAGAGAGGAAGATSGGDLGGAP